MLLFLRVAAASLGGCQCFGVEGDFLVAVLGTTARLLSLKPRCWLEIAKATARVLLVKCATTCFGGIDCPTTRPKLQATTVVVNNVLQRVDALKDPGGGGLRALITALGGEAGAALPRRAFLETTGPPLPPAS